MPEQTITLLDGVSYSVAWCGESMGTLGFELTGEMTLLDAATAFSDAEKTSQIVFTYGPGMFDSYEGFTDLIMLKKENRTASIIVSLAHRG